MKRLVGVCHVGYCFHAAILEVMIQSDGIRMSVQWDGLLDSVMDELRAVSDISMDGEGN